MYSTFGLKQLISSLFQLTSGHIRGRDLLELNDHNDNLPIHIACAEGNYDCAKALIEAGADVDNKNEDEQTPLHLAAIHGKVKVKQLSDISSVYSKVWKASLNIEAF